MRPPSSLTNGHGVTSHWKSSNCIRPMSKRILKVSGRVSLGRYLSPKGPHANATSMPSPNLPQRTPWKDVPAKSLTSP
jgi:hypothetical protein